MAMKINGPGMPGSVARSQRPAAKKAEEADTQAGAVDKVEVSGKEEAAQAAKAAKVPEVDRAKVAALRAAIRSGDYSPNLKLVAERMINESITLDR